MRPVSFLSTIETWTIIGRSLATFLAFVVVSDVGGGGNGLLRNCIGSGPSGVVQFTILMLQDPSANIAKLDGLRIVSDKEVVLDAFVGLRETKEDKGGDLSVFMVETIYCAF